MSAGSSSQCVPDLPRYGRGNDQGNDQLGLDLPASLTGEPWKKVQRVERRRQPRKITPSEHAREEVQRWPLQPGRVLGMNGRERSEVCLGVCRSGPQAQGSALNLQRVFDLPTWVVDEAHVE
jgi:hypothetical protein